MVPVGADVVEEMLFFRLERLGRRSIEPALAGLGPDTTRAPAAPCPSFDASIASTGRLPPIDALAVWFAAGSCVSLVKLLEAAWILLCRSSKLGDGKKSYVEEVFSSALLCPPNEKREWLFRVEALRVGSLDAVLG